MYISLVFVGQLAGYVYIKHTFVSYCSNSAAFEVSDALHGEICL
jgi:hypothetical protein